MSRCQAYCGPQKCDCEVYEQLAYPEMKPRALPPLFKWAHISECGKYRYTLERRWDHGPLLPFIMLNPSTADADIDDPTIRRCMGFACREGFGGIIVGNLFAFRATDPKVMLAAPNRVGPLNEKTLFDIATRAWLEEVPIVAAWGSNADGKGGFTVARLRGIGATVKCLGMTKGGEPRYPLYVKGDQPLVEYRK